MLIPTKFPLSLFFYSVFLLVLYISENFQCTWPDFYVLSNILIYSLLNSFAFYKDLPAMYFVKLT